MLSAADLIVSHGAAFDRAFLGGTFAEREWCCTLEDFAWPRQSKQGMGLVALALAHGITSANTAGYDHVGSQALLIQLDRVIQTRLQHGRWLAVPLRGAQHEDCICFGRIGPRAGKENHCDGQKP